MKKILVTNDDGFDSVGLKALVEALKELENVHVTVVAPTTEKSACGHSLTLTRPLRFVELDDDFYRLDDGTPTDCVYLSLHALFSTSSKPDLIISGINKGANMGEDITYSGTASACMEGVIYGVPSIAISQVCKDKCTDINKFDFALAKESIKKLATKVLFGGFPLGERKFLNVNIPPIAPCECKGFKITKAAFRLYGNDAQVHRNPRGEEYYWLGLHPLSWDNTKRDNTDFDAIFNNFVSITPVTIDMTSYEDLKRLENWI